MSIDPSDQSESKSSTSRRRILLAGAGIAARTRNARCRDSPRRQCALFAARAA